MSAASVADWNDIRTNAVLKAGEQVVLYLPVRLTQGISSAAFTKRRVQAQSAAPTSAVNSKKESARSKNAARPPASSANKPVRKTAKKPAKR